MYLTTSLYQQPIKFFNSILSQVMYFFKRRPALAPYSRWYQPRMNNIVPRFINNLVPYCFSFWKKIHEVFWFSKFTISDISNWLIGRNTILHSYLQLHLNFEHELMLQMWKIATISTLSERTARRAGWRKCKGPRVPSACWSSSLSGPIPRGICSRREQ